METRKENYLFDAEKTANELIQWVKDLFQGYGPDVKAILGMSGGKDSTVAAAGLCVAEYSARWLC